MRQVTWPIYVCIRLGNPAAVQYIDRNVVRDLPGTATLVQWALNICVGIIVSVWRGGGDYADVWVCVSTIPHYVGTFHRIRLPVVTVYIAT